MLPLAMVLWFEMELIVPAQVRALAVSKFRIGSGYTFTAFIKEYTQPESEVTLRVTLKLLPDLYA